MKIVVTNDVVESFRSPVLSGLLRELRETDSKVTRIGLDELGADRKAGLVARLADCSVLVHVGSPASAPEVIAAARRSGVPRFVLRSSVAVYGPSSGAVDERGEVRPQSELAQSFVAAERRLADAGFDQSLIVRAAMTAGRLGTDELGQRLYAPVLTGFGDADRSWQFVHHEDVSRVLALVAFAEMTGILNVAAPGTVPVTEIGNALQRRRFDVRTDVPTLVNTDRLGHDLGLDFGWTAHEVLADVARAATREYRLGGKRHYYRRRLAFSPTDVPKALPSYAGNELVATTSSDAGGEFDARIDPAFPVFTSSNLSEAFPGPMTAFSLDVMTAALRATQHWTSYLTNLDQRQQAEMDSRAVIPVAHRLYLNVSNIREMAKQLPGWSPEDIDEQYLGIKPTGTPAKARPSVAEVRNAATVAARFVPRVTGIRREADELRGEADYLLAEAARASELTDAALEARLRLAADMTAQGWNLAAFAFSIVGSAMAAAHKAVGEDQLDFLKVGSDSLTSAGALRGVYRLAAELKRDPELRALTIDVEGKPSVESLTTRSRRFAALFDEVLADIGHRGPGEGEFANKTFGDAPQQLLDTALSVIDRPQESASVSVPPLRARPAVNFARQCVRNREYARDVSVRVLHAVRLLARERGKRLAAEGIVDDPMDVFHLTLDEGLRPPADARTLVDRRKAERARLRDVRVPGVFELSWEPLTSAALPLLGEGEHLSGQPAAPGVVSGTVRVIDDAFDDDIDTGEILVAHVTDTGWTPLFGVAAAVVTDIGAMASHAAIVAREFGIPCVVGTQDATKRLTTGMWVEVDGAKGTVRCVKSAPPADD